AVNIANKPPDEEHPYGHGKAENIASMIVALLLIVIGIEVSISSVKIFFGETPSAPTSLALIIIIISIVLKELLFHNYYRCRKKINSSCLIIVALHHGSVFLSALAVLVVIGAAMLGSYTG